MEWTGQSIPGAPLALHRVARRLLPMMTAILLELSPLIAVAIVLKVF